MQSAPLETLALIFALCGDTVTADRGEALARKLGALCTKLFAAH